MKLSFAKSKQIISDTYVGQPYPQKVGDIVSVQMNGVNYTAKVITHLLGYIEYEVV